jgi:hypothetical protein
MRTRTWLAAPALVVLAFLVSPKSAHAQYWYSQARDTSFYSAPVNTGSYVPFYSPAFPATAFNVPAYNSYSGSSSYYLMPTYGYPAVSNYSPGYSNSYYLPTTPGYSSYYAAPSYSRYYAAPSYSSYYYSAPAYSAPGCR